MLTPDVLHRQAHAVERWNMLGGRVMAYLFAENDPLRMWRTQAIRDVCHEAGYRR